MALATSYALLLAVGLFATIVTAAGHRILRLGGLEFPSDSEHLLCSAALGVLCLQAFFVWSTNRGAYSCRGDCGTGDGFRIWIAGF